MKKICRDCHFLARDYRGVSGETWKQTVTKEERDKAEAGEIDFFKLKDQASLNCHMGVWDEGVKPGSDDRLERVNKTKRYNCFFYPYDEGMLFDAAKVLQKREQENRQLKRTNKFSTIGLWIAAIGLISGFLFNVYDRYTDDPPIKVEIQKQVEDNVKEISLKPSAIENAPTSQSTPSSVNSITAPKMKSR